MKVYLDKDKVQDKMFEQNIKSFRLLCKLSGISYGQLFQTFYYKSASPEMSWLIADTLNCDVMDIWSVDWTRDARRTSNAETKLKKS